MTVPCPWPGCGCLHVGCVAGWIDRTADDGRAIATPCPNCRPEVAEQLRRGPGTLAQVRARMRHVPRPSREDAGRHT